MCGTQKGRGYWTVNYTGTKSCITESICQRTIPWEEIAIRFYLLVASKLFNNLQYKITLLTNTELHYLALAVESGM